MCNFSKIKFEKFWILFLKNIFPFFLLVVLKYFNDLFIISKIQLIEKSTNLFSGKIRFSEIIKEIIFFFKKQSFLYVFAFID